MYDYLKKHGIYDSFFVLIPYLYIINNILLNFKKSGVT